MLPSVEVVVDVELLAQQLRDPDPRTRVQALRILAMVEETRALNAVRWLYKNDPETGVREVAAWAGKLLWEAEQRGHSTARAMEEMFSPKLTTDQKLRILAAVHTETDVKGKPSRRQLELERAYRDRLTWEFDHPLDSARPPAPDARALPDGGRAEPPGDQAAGARDAAGPLDFSDLLEAGLTYLKPGAPEHE